jgi:hypothetical protein
MFSFNFQRIEKGVQDLSLIERPHKNETMTHYPNDDHDFDSKMNEFGGEVEDDHEMILHNLEFPKEDLIDQGLDDLIKVEVPMQMVNLILQEQH